MVPDSLLIEAKKYLQGILGSDACSDDWAKPWAEASQLPFFLQTAYYYFHATLFGQPWLLMLARSPEGETPAVVRKHWQVVSKLYNGDVIYMIAAVSSYNRKRLIEHGVPFLVPGNQLFLPALGVDLREYFRPGRKAEVTHLSAPAQVVVLREILNHDCSGMPAKDLAQMLGYSAMTITRAVNELTNCQLAMAEKVGREKHLSFPYGGRSLWEAAQSVLQSPVTKRVWVSQLSHKSLNVNLMGRMTGESALAHYTDLADTHASQWAITSDTWSALTKSKDVQILASQPSDETSHLRKDREVIELELWAYNPDVITSNKSWVDPLSLWLSFEANTDDRIEIARESLLEQVWSTLSW
ncbi:conserved hypothetical protein [Hahella chejuensis KCTC 2396]|uniref:Uncharacterized protein n=1 Tax=Hahella chejuensis (strain KCTC 2396) TaxID=349521 RepID=Q2SMS1_HAHCH|nr:helix-turn-helix domain-containing protein [Hahella chejuensis]ABC28053.1 conserved hypothetical protein [Hahella chejuensis KCTC 2396]